MSKTPSTLEATTVQDPPSCLPSLDRLQGFCATEENVRKWDPGFDSILKLTATTGTTTVPWSILRELIKARMLHEVGLLHAKAVQCGQSLNRVEINAHLHVLGGYFNALTSAPFTVQRMCEIALTRQHSDVTKYLRQIERVVCVSSLSPDSDWATGEVSSAHSMAPIGLENEANEPAQPLSIGEM